LKHELEKIKQGAKRFNMQLQYQLEAITDFKCRHFDPAIRSSKPSSKKGSNAASAVGAAAAPKNKKKKKDATYDSFSIPEEEEMSFSDEMDEGSVTSADRRRNRKKGKSRSKRSRNRDSHKKRRKNEFDPDDIESIKPKPTPKHQFWIDMESYFTPFTDEDLKFCEPHNLDTSTDPHFTIPPLGASVVSKTDQENAPSEEFSRRLPACGDLTSRVLSALIEPSASAPEPAHSPVAQPMSQTENQDDSSQQTSLNGEKDNKETKDTKDTNDSAKRVKKEEIPSEQANQDTAAADNDDPMDIDTLPQTSNAEQEDTAPTTKGIFSNPFLSTSNAIDADIMPMERPPTYYYSQQQTVNLEERIKQELRSIGLLDESVTVRCVLMLKLDN